VKKCHDPGSPRNAKRYRQWTARFGAYRDAVTNSTIDSWLEQFDEADQDLAARILDVVEFFGQSQIHSAYREALTSLAGWHESKDKRKGKWRFVAMSGSAGESGDGMLYHFRVANHLDFKRYDEFFISRAAILAHNLGADDTVVLLDDFSGTGKQVCDAWTDPEVALGELLAGVGRVYLVLVAAGKDARKRIKEDTSISLMPSHSLADEDNVFSDKCKHFSAADRKRLEHYGKIADSKLPKGFGDCGYVVVFQHRTPNNSIPILHANHLNWLGLFPRHD
jgi:hypothetical protein